MGNWPVSGNVWLLIEQGFDADAIGRSGSVHSLCNGILGVRGGPDEWPDGHGTFLSDAFVQVPLNYHEKFPGYATSTDTRLRGPGVTGIRISIDGAEIDLATAGLVSREVVFDLGSAVLDMNSTWALADGRELTITSRRFVPLAGGALLAQRVTVVPVNFTGRIQVEFLVDMEALAAGAEDDPRISGRASFELRNRRVEPAGLVSEFGTAHDANLLLSVTQRVTANGPDLAIDENRFVTATCVAGEGLSADRLVKLELLLSADQLPFVSAFDELLACHAAAIAEFWKHAEVDLPADPELQLAIRYNLLQVFLSASRNPDFGTAAKGLSGEGYEGHSFWDNEVFVLPVLALTAPDLARTGIAYRIARLDRARANARAIGHARGALYPWRTIAGDECSAHYPTGSAQYHVNAAIAYALETYLHATGDTSVLVEGGAALLIETARLWFDLGHFSDRRGGAFLIHGVTGPDEYTALVDNDFYTNAMARRHLLFAAKAVETLAADDPIAHRQLSLDLGLRSEELGDWRRAAKRMWLPVDRELAVHPQDDTFMDKPLFPAPAEDSSHTPLLMKVHPMVLYRHRLTKQGDVLQAHITAGLDPSVSQIGRDFAYYEPLTTHDSTLSMTAFAICAAWLGDTQSSLDYWHRTALVDLANLHGNSEHGLHMAAMAGSWLVLAQGWAGLSLRDEFLRFAPRCPRDWPGYTLRLTWRGRLIELGVSPAETTYRLLNGGPIELFDRGRPVRLTGPEQVAVPVPIVDAVIFDLDGVLTDTAEWHYRAWKQLADAHGIRFDRQGNEALKGLERSASLRRILAQAGMEVDAATFDAMLAEKNAIYVQSIQSFSPAELFDGALPLLRQCRQAGLKIGLASASRNAATLIERLGIARWFDHVTDAGAITNGKPHPEIFLETARALGVAPQRCVGIEDAAAGIAAINAAGMASIGVGSAALLPEADRVFPAIGAIGLPDIVGYASSGSLGLQQKYSE